MSEEPTIPDLFKAYEEGKHRRYNLLFAVNGGAFAVARLFTTPEPSSVLGNLTLCQLSLGMALFTIVMVVDIFFFGQNMREREKVFAWQGKLVLTSVGALIAAGWTLVSFGVAGLCYAMWGYVGTIAAVWIPTELKLKRKGNLLHSPRS